MDKGKPSFIVGRMRSFGYAFKGLWILVSTEHSIIAQLIIAFFVTVAGFWLGLTQIEWMMQFLAIGIVLVAESMNTAIEKLCDFVHPDFNKKIGKIKDIAAGGVVFSAFTAIVIGLFIYLPKLGLF